MAREIGLILSNPLGNILEGFLSVIIFSYRRIGSGCDILKTFKVEKSLFGIIFMLSISRT